jgi:hypothetical protein
MSAGISVNPAQSSRGNEDEMENHLTTVLNCFLLWAADGYVSNISLI